MEGDVITTQDLFAFKVDAVTGLRDVRGHLEWTGLRPSFLEKLEHKGIMLPAGLLGPNGSLDMNGAAR
jgi:pilus assembly protein CpaF